MTFESGNLGDTLRRRQTCHLNAAQQPCKVLLRPGVNLAPLQLLFTQRLVVRRERLFFQRIAAVRLRQIPIEYDRRTSVVYDMVYVC